MNKSQVFLSKKKNIKKKEKKEKNTDMQYTKTKKFLCFHKSPTTHSLKSTTTESTGTHSIVSNFH